MKTEILIENRNWNRRTLGRIALCWCGSLVALLLATGCKSKSEATGGLDPVGTYTLVSVDGKTLPCVVAHEGSPTVQSGVFTISADGTCSSRIIFSTPAGKEISREVKATYTRTGSTLTMKWEGADMTKGNVAGNTFTMNNEGTVFNYRK